MRMRARSRFTALLLVACAALQSCGQLVRYTDEIVDKRTGRKWWVTVPATAGGFCGFVVGIPVDVVALPVTWSVYHIQRGQDKIKADPLSTMLFPSFALWRAGTMVGAPMDAVDYMTDRAWSPPPTPSDEEMRQLEDEFDRETLPEYPVEAIYPRAEGAP